MTAIEIPTPDPRTFDETSRPFAEALSAHFAIKRLIGRGGMGMVFLARDRRLDRLVAIKTLPPALAGDSDVRERFLRETRTAGGLAHANIVPIHGADEIDGHVFFVMAYVDGDSLAVHTRANGKLGAPAVGRYLRDVAAALAYAHKRGIIHRDIKAENILIDRETDRALVTDFGIARVAESSPLTVTGQVLGTVHYVSPEQVSGEAIDARSDIYSLGVVGYFALTGRFPFDADVASAVLVQHVTKTAAPVASVNRDVPPAIASIIDRCLMKDPEYRYGSADELHAALEAALPSLDRKPAVISDTAAHSVWQRAAELQANTGMQPRPAATIKPRSSTPKPKSSSPSGPGFRVGEVVAAASEAGIDERYVDRALAEHGLGAAGQRAVDLPPLAGTHTKIARASIWSSAKLESSLETTVEGEFPVRDIDSLVNILRDQIGSMGTVFARTRELAWTARSTSSNVEVAVVPEHGRTKISITRGMRYSVFAVSFAAALVAGLIGGVMVGGALSETFLRRDEEVAVFIGFLAGAVFSLGAGHLIVRKFVAHTEQRLRALADVIATKVRESVG